MKEKSLDSFYVLIGIVFSVLLIFAILIKYEKIQDEKLPKVNGMIDWRERWNYLG